MRFDLETLRNDRLVLESEKSGLETEVAVMREESEELKRALASMRSEAIALHANVLLAQRVVLPGSSEAQVSEVLRALAAQARIAVLAGMRDRLIPNSRELSIAFDPEMEAEVTARLTNSSVRCYVRALSVFYFFSFKPLQSRKPHIKYGLSLYL